MYNLTDGIYLVGRVIGVQPNKSGDGLRVNLAMGMVNHVVSMEKGNEDALSLDFGDTVCIKCDLWGFNGRSGFSHGILVNEDN